MEQHKLVLQILSLVFDRFDEFLQWKEEEEILLIHGMFKDVLEEMWL